MAQTLDFYIDVSNGQVVAAGSVQSGVLPTLTRNDSYTFRVRLQERDTNNNLRDIDTTGASVKLGIGEIDDGPTSGAFKLVINGVTSNAITYNTDEATVAGYIYTAVSNNVSTVVTYGLEPDSYILTATQPNTAMSFGGSSFTLFPTSSVLISTRRFPAVGVEAQQIVKLRRNPAVYADTFTATPTAGVVSLTKTQDGSAASGLNETYKLIIGKDAEGGGVVLNYGSNSTTAVPIGASAVCFSEALSAVTGIGANNISVDSGDNLNEYTISFVRSLGATNITTALTVDAKGVVFASFLQSTVTMATAELDELFAEAGTDTISPTIEIEVTSGGTPKTVYQNDITVRRDLITTGSVVPAAQASYYTKSEADALFVEDEATNVDATNRELIDSSVVQSISWEGRKLYRANGTEVLRYDQGLGFFGVTATAQPTGPNVVSNLIQLGLNPNSTVTQGVLPLSVRTVTTTASLNFGTVGSNSTVAITVSVTGVNLNDIVLLGLPNAICQGLTFIGAVDSAGVVQVDAVNATSSSVVQSTQTFRITAIGY
jgi:hypothetical protein